MKRERRTWTGEENKTISLKLPQEVMNEIEKIAKSQKLLLSQTLGTLIEEFLDRYEDVELIDLPFDVPKRLREKDSKNTVTTTVTVSSKLRDRIQRYKDKKRITLNQLIVLALSDYLDRKTGRGES